MMRVNSKLISLVPDAPEGWQIAGKDQVYQRDNLYDYIDGGAELYLSYGFRKVCTRTYSKSDQPEIVLDLFAMKSSKGAFGVFSHSRETVDATFGQGSQYTEGMLLFWKDRYYISIYAYPETAASKKAIFALAQKIDRAIPKEGQLPEILSFLPQNSLVKESVRYFSHHAWLNTHYFISDQNVLHINENTDALLAKYGERKRQCLLLLVEYKSGEEAEQAYTDFLRSYQPALSKKGAVQVEDGSWTACQLRENLLMAVFNAVIKDDAVSILEEVQKIVIYKKMG